ncbi:hypothetical protein [Bacillus sp. USDA818B3_A]|uniref:hypothetical protein n=1 Tax=Bacillus sp. USDA818B3_A TaxID=2698834 RepID=UPI00136DE790|nr:hypothetical protein [Bacillus sp. USDA818B3_A]
MANRYFTEKDYSKAKQSYYNFYKDEETGGLRAFNGLRKELTVEEVKEIIDGLTTSYLKLRTKIMLNAQLLKSNMIKNLYLTS